MEPKPTKPSYPIHSRALDPEIRGRYLRSLLLLGAVLLLSLLVLVPVAGTLLTRSFVSIERDDTIQKLQQVYRAFEADALQLDIANRDYAEWNDALAFARQRNAAFIDANFTPETLSGLHVDLVLVVDSDGTDIYSALYDRETEKLQSPPHRSSWPIFGISWR